MHDYSTGSSVTRPTPPRFPGKPSAVIVDRYARHSVHNDPLSSKSCAKAEQEAVRRDGGGTRQEEHHPVRRRAERLEHAPAVQRADRAEDLPGTHRLADP